MVLGLVDLCVVLLILVAFAAGYHLGSGHTTNEVDLGFSGFSVPLVAEAEVEHEHHFNYVKGDGHGWRCGECWTKGELVTRTETGNG